MAVYADLDPLPYFGEEYTETLRAVGWLEHGTDFPTGTVREAVIDRLNGLLAAPFHPLFCAGSHECDLCQFDGPSGTNNLIVPGNGVLYVLPELALHYIAAHWYQPPEVFLDAVLNCPAPSSMAYRRSFLQNGGRSLVR